jgi:hypothetical protein
VLEQVFCRWGDASIGWLMACHSTHTRWGEL